MTRRRAAVLFGGLTLAAFVSVALSAQSVIGPSKFYAMGAGAPLVEQGLALAAPTGVGPLFTIVPAPGVRNIPNDAQATAVPWVDSNAWRFKRGITRASYPTLPRNMSPLAAGEAFAFGVDALLNPDAADLPVLSNFLRFAKSEGKPVLPTMANIGLVDDGSPAMDEVMNMLTRRNLLYRIVSRPDPSLNLFLQIGTDAFTRESAANPSDFAQRVRAWVGDDNRLVRVFGSTTLIAHLTGDGTRVRLFLLSYSRSRAQMAGAIVRLKGMYEPSHFAAFGAAPGDGLTDLQHPGNATEFTLPGFDTLAIIDFTAVR